MSVDYIPQLETWRAFASSEERSGIRIAKFHTLPTGTGLITCRNKVENNGFCTEQCFCTGVCGNSLRVDTEYKPKI